MHIARDNQMKQNLEKSTQKKNERNPKEFSQRAQKPKEIQQCYTHTQTNSRDNNTIEDK